MKMNKIIFISLILLTILLSVSFVGAADTNITEDTVCISDINGIDDAISLSENPETDEIIGSTVSVNTFDELRQAVKSPNQVINLNNDIARRNDDNQHIKIIGNITINGNGHKIDSLSKARIFIVYGSGELTLNNVKLVNGNGYYGDEPKTSESTESGGAIFNMGKLTITDCTFENNVARQGGAIGTDYSTSKVIIKGTTTFLNNRVVNNGGTSGMDGGAIHNTGGSTLEIYGKTTFDGNTAVCTPYSKAGAILNAFRSTMKISGETTFTNNRASLDGGAIFNHQATATIDGVNKYINNRADGGDGKGGVINNEDATFTLTGTNTFDSNYANRGGAIDNSLLNSVFTISGTNVFKNNKATDGGAIASFEGIKLNIYGENTFIQNSAENIGGAISTNTQLNINAKNSFIENTAKQTGGAIYSANNAVINGENLFSKNKAGIEGGAILLINSNNVQIGGNNRFDSNTAPSAGGAIRAINVDTLTFNNHNYFSNNVASFGGGAVYLTRTNLNSQGALYESNRAPYGGAISLDNSKLTANYNIFKYNSADYTGSNIQSYQSTIINLNYNYWNSQDKAMQNSIQNYDVSNIKNWAILDLTVPSTIKQDENTEVLRFKTNTYGNLGGEMPDYNVYVNPNFSPNLVTISKNVGTAKYTGNTGQVTVTASSSNFAASRTVNVVEGKVKTSLNGNNILLTDPTQSATYVVTLSDDNGNKLSGKTVTITVDSKKYEKTTNNRGEASLTLNDLTNGFHSITSTYAGENKYYESSTTNGIICIFSNVSNTKLTGKDIEMYYKDGTRYEVTLTDASGRPMASKDVKFFISGSIYTRTTDSNGKASIAINLNSGEYTILACYPVNSRDFSFTQNKITVKPSIYGDDIVKYYKNGTQYYAKFLDKNGNPLKNTGITFNINGVFYTRSTNDQGVARMNINLNPGTYTITAQNPENGEMHSNKVTVLGIFEGKDLTKYFRNASQYSIKILGGDGNPIGKGVKVKFNINGVFYERVTDASGIAKLNINLNPGTYTITAEYNGLMHTNTIKVRPILYADNINMRYKDGTRFKVKLVDGQGNAFANQTVQFNVNGVFYSRVTGDDGYASLAINLMPGQYIITSAYGDARLSNKITIS